MNHTQILALIIFIVTYIGIIADKLPLLRLNRKSIAFVGSIMMIVFGVISFEDAIKSIDFDTITLLLGMMIIISTLRLEGFFTFISHTTMTKAKTTNLLLFSIVFITGFASAFLVNDVVVLLFTPIIIQFCRKAELNPLPFLLAEIFASNAGSLMSITGNPQNMIIGIASQISYGKFMLIMLPIAILSMLIIILVIKKSNTDIFRRNALIAIPKDASTYDFKTMRNSLIIFCLVVVAFFLSKIINLSIPLIALGGASLTLIFTKQDGKQILAGVDWSLLLFFASLFIIVAAIRQSGVLDIVFEISLQENTLSILVIFLLSLILSQLVSNVPYVVLVLPIFALAKSDILWLSLAASSTLAGNLTIIGAMANLIVIEQAQKENVRITPQKFYRSSILITLSTYILAIAFLSLLSTL
jgi:Na+/H+ antiporter NhaD/arsenite permease-like protein